MNTELSGVLEKPRNGLAGLKHCGTISSPGSWSR